VPPRRAYDPLPCYPPTGGRVGSGWADLVAELDAAGGGVLAIDGPAILDWPGLVTALTGELRTPVELVPVTDYLAGWDQIRKRTAPVDALRDDPDFATLPSGSLAELFDELPSPASVPGRLGGGSRSSTARAPGWSRTTSSGTPTCRSASRRRR
jgi:hypothetical protein